MSSDQLYRECERVMCNEDIMNKDGYRTFALATHPNKTKYMNLSESEKDARKKRFMSVSTCKQDMVKANRLAEKENPEKVYCTDALKKKFAAKGSAGKSGGAKNVNELSMDDLFREMRPAQLASSIVPGAKTFNEIPYIKILQHLLEREESIDPLDFLFEIAHGDHSDVLDAPMVQKPRH